MNRIPRYKNIDLASIIEIKRDIISVLEVIGNLIWIGRVDKSIDEVHVEVKVRMSEKVGLKCRSGKTRRVAS